MDPKTQSDPQIKNLAFAVNLLKNSLRVYREQARTFIGISLILMLSALLFYFFLEKGTLLILNVDTLFVFLFYITLLFVVSFIISLLNIWQSVALIYAVKDRDEHIGIKESYRRAWHKIRSYLWIVFLGGTIITAGYIFFFIPGILFSVWFSLAGYILVNENVRGMNALLKSREYVSELWWSVAWRLMFFVLILILVGIPLVIIVAIADALKAPFLDAILIFPFALVIAPLSSIYHYLLYENIKSLKGEIVFTPSGKSKTFFITIGVLGLIIIPILLILPIALIALNPPRKVYREESRTNAEYQIIRLHDRKQIQGALELYYADHKVYPPLLFQLPAYIKSVAVDPQTKLPYEYQVLEDGADYELCIAVMANRQCVNSTTFKVQPKSPPVLLK